LIGLSKSGTQAVSQQRLRNARLAAQVANLQAQAASNQYNASATVPRGATLDVLNPATGATSDRNAIAERYGLIGALGGLVIGIVLVTLFGRLRERARRRTFA
jgi:hypothetical protein